MYIAGATTELFTSIQRVLKWLKRNGMLVQIVSKAVLVLEL